MADYMMKHQVKVVAVLDPWWMTNAWMYEQSWMLGQSIVSCTAGQSLLQICHCWLWLVVDFWVTFKISQRGTPQFFCVKMSFWDLRSTAKHVETKLYKTFCGSRGSCSKAKCLKWLYLLTYLLNVSASTSCWDISVWTEVAGPWNQLEFCNFSHWTSSLHIFLSVTYHCIIIRFKYVLFFLYLPREVMFLVKFLGFVNRITGTLQAQIHFWIQMKRTSDNRTGSSLFIHMTQTEQWTETETRFLVLL